MHKCTFLFLIFTMLFSATHAQSEQAYKPIRVDVSLGYAGLSETGTGGGLFSLEPKYAILNQLALGFRIETALLVRTYHDVYENSETKIAANTSYAVTGDFYLVNNRPFRMSIGAGGGLFLLAKVNFNDAAYGSADKSVKPGALFRAGFEYSHFRLAAEYNIVGSSNYDVSNYNTAINNKKL